MVRTVHAISFNGTFDGTITEWGVELKSTKADFIYLLLFGVIIIVFLLTTVF